MSVTIKLEGLSELKDTLRTLPDATAKNILRRVGKARLKPIAEQASALAPKRKGKLSRSIVVSTKLSKAQRSQHRKFNDSDVEIFAGASPLVYSHMVEYGSIHNKPHPFMRPAWDAGKDKLFNGIKDDLWKEIEKALARRARKAAKAA
jgi:HK97 gp10 family phage protein